MSIYSVLNVGVLGVQAQSHRISTISDNISNVSTVGYKGLQTQFSSLVNNQMGTTNYFNSSRYDPAGVSAGGRQLNINQGEINPTDIPTDIAINGNGFFVVSATSTDTSLLYTRAGSFTTDKQGNLVNGAGFYLKGWQLDDSGALDPALQSSTHSSGTAISALRPVNVQALVSTPIATSTLALRANLNAGQTTYDPNANPDLRATGSIAFAANPSPGDTISLNGVTWTFVASGATGNQTNIGASRAATLTQLAVDLNASTNANVSKASFIATASNLNVTYKTESSDGEDYALGVDRTNATVSGSTLSIGAATGSIAFTGNASNGDTITINGVPWTFVTSGAVGNQTNIGVDRTATLAQLAADLNASVDASISPATFTATASNLNITYDTAGVAGGSYTLASANPNAVVSGATLDLPIATGNIAFTDNPLPGETITLGGVTWTFVASGATGNQTNIGVNLTATLGQLAIDLNASTDVNLSAASFAATPTHLNIAYDTNAAAGGSYTLAARVANSSSASASLVIPSATGSITFTANPSPGDTINLNGVTWTFVASGATGNQTNIGASRAATLTQLAADLNLSQNSIIDAATYVATPTALTITYDTSGSAGDHFRLTSGNANAVVSDTTLSLPITVYNPALNTNNMTGGLVPAHFTRPLEIIDNNGISHTVNAAFLKTANNTWAVELYAAPAGDVTIPGGQIATGTLTFNGDGTLASVSSSLASAITFPWTSTGTTPTGAAGATINNTITFAWGTAGPIYGTPGATVIGLTDGMTQLTKEFSVVSTLQDGSKSGALTSIDISQDGIVSANYNNGVTHALYKIPLANFHNADALTNFSGNVYANSDDAGFINMFGTNTGGTGFIESGALEASNVDLAEQLTDIVIAQRAYQANTKLITTSDDMLKTATQMLN